MGITTATHVPRYFERECVWLSNVAFRETQVTVGSARRKAPDGPHLQLAAGSLGTRACDWTASGLDDGVRVDSAMARCG